VEHVGSLEVAFGGHSEHRGGEAGGLDPHRGDDLVVGEHVEAALLTVAVGVLRRGEAAPGEREVAEQVVERVAGHGDEPRFVEHLGGADVETRQ